MISQSQIQQFNREGFLITDVFTAEETARFRDAVDDAIDQRGDKPEPMSERTVFDRMFTQYFNLWETSADVRALTFHPRLAEIASALVECPIVRVYCDQSFYKEPGSSETGVHQDYPLLSIEETRTVNAWVALEGCSLDAGAIGYVPGSHRFGRFTNVDKFLGKDPFDNPELRALAEKPVFFELAPGSVAFHHVLTFHLSRPNRSNHVRKAFAITYFADGSTRGTTWPHASVDRAGIEVGEPIRGPATPIAWPASGVLPSVPPPNPHPPRRWPGYREPAAPSGVKGT